MLDIYAKTFMTAARSPCVKVRDLPAKPTRKRWFRRTRCIDPAKL